MNRFLKICQLQLLLSVLFAAQALCQDAQLFVIGSYPLEITYNKTVNLIFPFEISSVDKGSRAVLAQKAKGVQNILQLKAADKNFQQTNLTVITSDGKLYSFILDYADEPDQLNIELVRTPAELGHFQAVLENQPNQQLLDTSAKLALTKVHRSTRVRAHIDKISFLLTGLFVKDDVIFCRFKIDNSSSISYDIESIRFFVSDKKKVKRAALQQTEIIPIYASKQTAAAGAKQEADLVFAFAKFTLPDAKKLVIQLTEKNGGRHLNLKVQNKAIIRAAAL